MDKADTNKEPPNYRPAKRCRTCDHANTLHQEYFPSPYCTRYDDVMMHSYVCDDWTPISEKEE